MTTTGNNACGSFVQTKAGAVAAMIMCTCRHATTAATTVILYTTNSEVVLEYLQGVCHGSYHDYTFILDKANAKKGACLPAPSPPLHSAVGGR
jgi:hypothetical protein|eukprot:CAMPEP_0174293566 /NCGR_PEP_ID=MMETSP0809-20121228/38978_1 /TAXON_ID=73025 ORGANISM="Eutreptiella gymnastica-like, Strain CCMP1594" /NCGR_SAMPLE_ID=MMETSP0809 /ASSEMBLY_ACC=CAM_ASM_000658 /LENGTH=92 /DNA_ID=CAMNT_0015394425 /DNA_START=298 /DNA_END=576 /DNA_ORIENTATION=+